MPKSKRKIRREIRRIAQELENQGCTFQFCPGPKRPFEDMATCGNCILVKELRQLAREL